MKPDAIYENSTAPNSSEIPKSLDEMSSFYDFESIRPFCFLDTKSQTSKDTSEPTSVPILADGIVMYLQEQDARDRFDPALFELAGEADKRFTVQRMLTDKLIPLDIYFSGIKERKVPITGLPGLDNWAKHDEMIHVDAIEQMHPALVSLAVEAAKKGSFALEQSDRDLAVRIGDELDFFLSPLMYLPNAVDDILRRIDPDLATPDNRDALIDLQRQHYSYIMSEN